MAKIKKFKLDTDSVKADVAKIGAGARKDRETATDSMMSEMGKRKAAPAKPAAKQSFSAAFAAARKDPEAMKRGTFTYNGKSFTTKLASEKKAAPKPTAKAPAAKAKDYVPKGGTKMGAPSTAKAPAGSMLTKTPPKNSSAYTGPVKTGSEARASFAGAKSAGFTGLTSTPKAAPKPASVSDVIRRDSKGKPVSLSPERMRKLKDAAARSGTRSSGLAKGGAVDGIAKRGKTRARSK